MRKIAYNEAVWRGMLAGIDKMADTVKVTLGPRGRNVALYQKANLRGADYADRAQAGAHVLITNDGATIAQGIVLDDPLENLGAQLLREAALKVNEGAGDGTTTAIVLTQSILHGAWRSIASGADPLALRRGLQAAAGEAVRLLRRQAVPVRTQEEMAGAAAVSCQDQELGSIIGRALFTVGLEGVVTVEDGQRVETTLDLMEGIVFDRGFRSPVMATNEQRTAAELHNPYILLCDTKFTDPQDLIPALLCAAEDGRPCLVISDGIEGEALGLVHANREEGDLDIVCVEAPLYGEGRRWRMEDLAIQTGGVFISKERGMEIRSVTREMLGTARFAEVTRNRTVITGGGGDPEAIRRRIEELRHLVAHTDYAFNRERYQERLAKFVSGVARINVGGRTEAELWERKLRVEDALHAARAACVEGVVAGGGAALLSTASNLRDLAGTLEGDERTGALLLARAAEAPVRQIAENAGLDGGAVAARMRMEAPGTGYDAEKDQWVDLVQAGVVDPLMVTRTALECAVSVASTLLTSQAGIAGFPDEAEMRKEERA